MPRQGGKVSEDGLHALETELAGTAPSSLGALAHEHLVDLATAVRDARHRQASELAAAGDKALGHIPRLLRGPVRKVLG
jgi:hypothetical protein